MKLIKKEKTQLRCLSCGKLFDANDERLESYSKPSVRCCFNCGSEKLLDPENYSQFIQNQKFTEEILDLMNHKAYSLWNAHGFRIQLEAIRKRIFKK